MLALAILTLLQLSVLRFHSNLLACCAGVIFFRCTSHMGDQKMAKFVKLLKNKKGATAIEYGLIAALIAVAAIGAMQGIGNKLNTTFNNVSNSLS